MKKSLIITVAGLSSRFNQDAPHPVLKCLYHEGDPDNSLLSRQIRLAYPFADDIIVVGGFKYDELEHFVQFNIPDPAGKVRLVYNEHFRDYGSCYSLVKGIDALVPDAGEVVFVEGDLFFHETAIRNVFLSDKDVLTICREPIYSDKAVALYLDETGHPHYLYDTTHSSLQIDEPFTAIFNSAQIWKFHDSIRLKEISTNLTVERLKGTNLEVVQRYFYPLCTTDFDTITIEDWFNCNTVADYQSALNSILKP